jgi:NADPH:quinone reductase-like Zn-dependent oxidoreductase
MKAAAVMTGGAPVAPNVELIDLPTPSPGAGEVRVRTEASGLNHLDVWVGMGIPGVDRPWPRVTGSDGVGIVDAVGEGVDDVWVGRRVIMNAAHDLNSEDRSDGRPAGEQFHLVGEQSPGAMAEAFVVRVTNVMDIGEADPIEAAAFGLTHLTAWRMLTTRAGARAGDWVLIPGIGGGVALAALGICRYLGCRTIVTSRSAEKLQRASELGASVGILDEGKDWNRAVRAATDGAGVDICIDSIGKAVHLSCIKSLGRGGRFVTCGCTSGPGAETDLARIFWNQLSILGSTMGDMREFQEVVGLFLKGSLQPVVDRVVTPSEVPEAYAALEAGTQFGKLVVDWRP